MNNQFLSMVYVLFLGLTSSEITIVLAVGSVFFIFVVAIAPTFFKKYSKSNKNSVRSLQLFRILI